MTTNGNIPFLDLVSQHRQLEEELVEVFRTSLRSAAFIGGPAVEGFEREFAQFCDTEYCVGVGSGTDALRFALTAAGVDPGDVVITVPHTFIATTEAISQAGALPEFVDVEERTHNLDPRQLQQFLETKCEMRGERLVHRATGKRVKAVVPVHLYGQMADMDAIMSLAGKYGLVVVEDACQAHGAEYFSSKEDRWRKAGSIGQAAAFSFYPGKNLGACGEAGAITTHDPEIARKSRMLRDHGQAKKYYHDVEGYNGRLDAIQAGFLSVKLKHLASWNAQRRQRAADYNRLLAATSELVIPPYEPYWSRAVYHLYVVRTANREALMAHLNAGGIGTGIHYPIPLHLQNAYAARGLGKGSFPVSEKLAAQILSLPMFPNLTSVQQARVVEQVLRFASKEVAVFA